MNKVENALNGFYSEIKDGNYEFSYIKWMHIKYMLFELTEQLFQYNMENNIPNSNERFIKYRESKNGKQ